MSSDTPDMPSELRDRLRDEPAEERSDLEAVWELLGTVEDAADDASESEEAWTALTRRHPELEAPPEDGERAPDRTRAASRSRRRQRTAQRPRRQRRRTWAWGVVLAALVLAGGLWLWRQPVTVTAPAGQQRTATLPDGSTVELNSGTRLAYRRGFQAWPFVDADERTVRLDGEAFFEVRKGERPFQVTAANAQVSVLGTRFNVRGRVEEDGATEVTVVRGRVRVAPRKRPERGVVLSTPGHTSRVLDPEASPTTPESTDVERILAWRSDGFAVHARSLSDVLRELERRYDTSIQIHGSVDRPEAPVSLYYPGPTNLETILHDLCRAKGLNYRPTSRGFEVFAGPNSR